MQDYYRKHEEERNKVEPEQSGKCRFAHYLDVASKSCIKCGEKCSECMHLYGSCYRCDPKV